MSVGDQTDPGATVDASFDRTELAILNNALNEVCNGVDIDDAEFSARIGADRERAEGLRQRIASLLDQARKN
jgi:hypothetical protein